MIEVDSDDSFDELILEGCKARKLQTPSHCTHSELVKKFPVEFFTDDEEELSPRSLSESKLDPRQLSFLSDESSSTKPDSFGSLPEAKELLHTDFTDDSDSSEDIVAGAKSAVHSSRSSHRKLNTSTNQKSKNKKDSDSSDDDEAYEKFLEKMKKDATSRRKVDSRNEYFTDDDGDDSSLGGFIVADDESLSEGNSGEEETAFYLKTNNLLSKPSPLLPTMPLSNRNFPLDDSLSEDEVGKELSDLILSDISSTTETNTSERSNSVYLHSSLLSEDDDVFKEPPIPSATREVRLASISDSDESFDELLREGLQKRNPSKGSAVREKANRQVNAALLSNKKKLKDSTNLDLSLPSLSDSDDDVMLVAEAIKTPAPKNRPTTYTSSASRIQTNSRLKKPQSSFIASLSTHFDENKQRHQDANKYVKQFKKHKEELVERLAVLFDQTVFDNKLSDVKVTFNKRLLKTAGLCKYLTTRTNKTRQASVELSDKVCDTAERVRDTLVHEMCHAAVWIVNGVEDGHGRYWQFWGKKAELVHKELPPIRRCHSYDITTKFVYQCTKCKYQVGRHSKSLDTQRKVCGRCRGKFELLTRTVEGLRTPSASTPNKFALFVKENYGSVRKETPSHKKAMQQLSQQFSGQLKF